MAGELKPSTGMEGLAEALHLRASKAAFFLSLVTLQRSARLHFTEHASKWLAWQPLDAAQVHADSFSRSSALLTISHQPSAINNHHTMSQRSNSVYSSRGITSTAGRPKRDYLALLYERREREAAASFAVGDLIEESDYKRQRQSQNGTSWIAEEPPHAGQGSAQEASWHGTLVLVGAGGRYG